MPEDNVRNSVFLKHRTKWNSVSGAVRSFTWITILRSADPLVAFDRAISEVICMYVSTTVLRSKSGDMQWFDASCRRAYDAKQTAYRAWCRASYAEHCRQFEPARAKARGSMVQQWSRIMSASGILCRTPPVDISGGRH